MTAETATPGHWAATRTVEDRGTLASDLPRPADDGHRSDLLDAPPAPRPIARDVTELIGGTPLIELGAFTAARGLDVRLLGKLEQNNPLGSVKDRIAWGIISDAEQAGRLHRGDLIVDITSGNTGIALAALAARRGYRTKFYLGDNISPDKTHLLRALGAELVPVPNETFLDPEALEILFARAQEENPGAFIADQLANPSNPRFHYRTTGPEIWADTGGEVDILISGVGTGGTVSGAGRYLKDQRPELRVVVAEPGDASVPNEEELYPEEIDGVHKVVDVEDEQLPPNYDIDIADEVIAVEAEAAYAVSRALLREEGLLLGPSGGAAVAVAQQLASRPENAGRTIVAVLPDTGERYLSAGVFSPKP